VKNKIGIFNKRLLVSFLAAVTIATSLGMISLTFFPTYAYATEDSQDDSGTNQGIIQDSAGIYGEGSNPYNSTTGNSNTSSTLGGEKNPFYIKWIINILKSPGENFNSWFLQPNKMTMNNIIFGRLEKNTPVNYYQFELMKGNPYGIIGAYLYNIFRTLMIVILSCLLIGSITKGLVLTNNSKAREELKSAFGKALMFAMALYLMPYAFQVLMYIRDAFLYVIRSVAVTIINIDPSSLNDDTVKQMVGSESITNVTSGLNAVFSAIGNTTILGALMYDGFIVLTIYFAATYVGAALSVTLYFVMFPFVCVVAYYDKNVFSTWVKSVISALLIPVIDGVLLLIPSTMFVVLLDVNWVLATILTFMICAMIVPSRRVIGRLLGLDMGISNLGATAMSMMAVGRGLAGVGRAIRGARSHFASAKESKEQAAMYGEMAQAEEDVYGAPEGMRQLDDVQTASSMQADNSGGMRGILFNGGTAGAGGSGWAGRDSALENAGMQTENASLSLDNTKLQQQNNENRRQMNQLDVKAANYGELKNGYQEKINDNDRLIEENQVRAAQNSYSMAQNKENDMALAQQLAMRQQQIYERHANIGMIGTPQFNNLSSATKARLMRENARKEKARAVGSIAGSVYAGSVALGSGMFMGAPVQAMLVGGAASMGGAVGSSVGNLTDTAIHSRPATYVTSGAARRVSDVYTRTYNSDTRAGTVLRTAGGVRSDISSAMSNLNRGMDQSIADNYAKIRRNAELRNAELRNAELRNENNSGDSDI